MRVAGFSTRRLDCPGRCLVVVQNTFWLFIKDNATSKLKDDTMSDDECFENAMKETTRLFKKFKAPLPEIPKELCLQNPRNNPRHAYKILGNSRHAYKILGTILGTPTKP